MRVASRGTSTVKSAEIRSAATFAAIRWHSSSSDVCFRYLLESFAESYLPISSVMSNPTTCSVLEPSTEAGPTATASILCQSCNTRLPIRTAGWMELPALWRCIRCGSHHCGVLPAEARPVEARAHSLPHVVLAAQYFDCQPSTLQHEWADALIEHLHQQELHTAITDKRTSPRVARNLHAQVIAVDESWAPRGRPFPVIVYNISTGGLAYVSATINRAQFLAIQLAAGQTLQVVAQSIWARPEHGGLFSVGVKFLCRLGAGSA